MKSFAIIGTGAIGGYCAVRLQQAGFDVHCLLRHDFEVVQKNGLQLIENNETIIAPVKAYNNIDTLPPCDVIIVALKSTANFLLKNSLTRLLSKGGHVVFLQNGIGVEEEFAELINPEKIIGATCILKLTKIAPGVIKHFGHNKLELAQYFSDENHEEITSMIQELVMDFKKAGIDAEAFPHLTTIRWKKLIGNIPNSGLPIVLNATLNELVKNPASFALLKRMTQEAILAAKICGAKIPDDFFEFRERVFQSFLTMEPFNSSMKDDFDAKKPLELHTIYENAISIAKKHKAQMPLTEMLYQQLLYLEEQNR